MASSRHGSPIASCPLLEPEARPGADRGRAGQGQGQRGRKRESPEPEDVIGIESHLSSSPAVMTVLGSDPAQDRRGSGTRSRRGRKTPSPPGPRATSSMLQMATTSSLRRVSACPPLDPLRRIESSCGASRVLATFQRPTTGRASDKNVEGLSLARTEAECLWG